jgi:hypothetical protein
MDGRRFDAWTKHLIAGTSRRAAVRTLGGILVGGLLSALDWNRAAADDDDDDGSGNSACAHFCNQAFPPGRERGQCKSDAAHGGGPCYQCGPEAPPCSPGKSRQSATPPCRCRCTDSCPGQFQDPTTCVCRGGGIPRCDGVRCNTVRNCGGRENCYCNRSVEGIGFCIRGSAQNCVDYERCRTSADCPEGLCLDVAGCCPGRPRLCVPFSAACPGTVPPPSPPPSPPPPPPDDDDDDDDDHHHGHATGTSASGQWVRR